MIDIGDREKFATSFDLNSPNHGGPWLYGKFCYWVGGVQFGNYDGGATLRDVLFTLEGINASQGKRTDESLFLKEKVALFHALDADLFGDQGNISDNHRECLRSKDISQYFYVTPEIEGFDNSVKLYLVNSEKSSRILYKYNNSLDVSELVLPVNEFEFVISCSVKILRAIYEANLMFRDRWQARS